jgi:hypothetical protein
MGVASCKRGRPPSCGVVLEPMGVASCRRGGMGRPTPGCPSLVPFTTGRALGDGGIERPRAGLRGPRPGTGARSTGTGEAMLGWGLDVPLAEKPGSIYSCVFARAPLVARPTRLSIQQVLPGSVGSSRTVRCRQPRNADRLVRAAAAEEEKKEGRGGRRAVVEVGLEDWAANVTLRATSPRQVRLAGGRRDSGRVRLQYEGVTGRPCWEGSCKGRCYRQSTAWLAGRFRMLDCRRGSRQLWRGEPAGAC